VQLNNRRRLAAICLVIGVFGLSQINSGPVWGQNLQKPRATILEFSRELCPMCAYMEKSLDQIKAKYGDQIEVRLLYFDPDAKLFRQYQVVFVPTQVFLDAAGKEVFRQTGVSTPYELTKKLKELKLIKTP
jgi:thioredoxin 1